MLQHPALLIYKFTGKEIVVYEYDLATITLLLIYMQELYTHLLNTSSVFERKSCSFFILFAFPGKKTVSCMQQVKIITSGLRQTKKIEAIK